MDNKLYSEEELQEALDLERHKVIDSIVSRCNCSDLDQVVALAKIGSYTNTGKKILNLCPSDKGNASEHDEAYISCFSNKAQELIKNYKPNVYHSVMARIHIARCEYKSVDSLYADYMKRNAGSRPYLTQFESELKEIMQVCLEKMKRRRSK